jgi:hypothetical protein
MAPPLLPPLSSVAGSLALSFTGAAQSAAPAPPPATTAAPAEPVVPAPPPATPPPATAPADPLTSAPPMTPPPSQEATAAEVRESLEPKDGDGEKTVTRKPILRPTDKRFFFTLLVGGTKALLGGYNYFPGADFKLEAAIGGHGRVRKQLGGAAVLQLKTGAPFSSFTVAPRVQWDKQIVPEYAIYLNTTLMAGYRLTTYGAYGPLLGLVGGAYHGGVVGVGWGASMIVAERLLLSFRPVNFELQAPGPGFAVNINWDAMGGLGVVW